MRFNREWDLPVLKVRPVNRVCQVPLARLVLRGYKVRLDLPARKVFPVRQRRAGGGNPRAGLSTLGAHNRMAERQQSQYSNGY